MADEDDARRACAVLGWTWVEHLPGPDDGWCVRSTGDRFEVEDRDGFGPPRLSVTVDLPTLMLAAALAHAPTLDVGPCPECEGRREHVKATGQWPEEGWALRKSTHPAVAVEKFRACTACVCADPYLAEDARMASGDGKPTGRRIVSASEAVVMGAEREEFACHGDAIEAMAQHIERWRAQGRALRQAPARGGMQRWVFVEPGHEGARAALARLASMWREHLPVLADWMLDAGEFDTDDRERLATYSVRAIATDGRATLEGYLATGLRSAPSTCHVVPEALAECPAIPAWVGAWLASACDWCVGSGERDADIPFQAPPEQVDCTECAATGLAIGPHAPAIRARVRAMWETATIECGCWPSGLDGSRRRWVEPRLPPRPDSRASRSSRSTASEPCQRCAGLGRVSPDRPAA